MNNDNDHLETRIKLKTGFFRKKLYLLLLNNQEIILKQEQKKQPKEFKVKASEVKTIIILSEKPPSIEIITDTESYMGDFIDQDDISEIIILLNQIFDKKFEYY